MQMSANCSANAVCPAPKLPMKDMMAEVLNQQNKSLQLLATLKHDIIGIPVEVKAGEPECVCMLDAAELMSLRENEIVDSLLTIMEALGLGQ